MKKTLLTIVLCLVVYAHANAQEHCESDAIQVPAKDLLNTLKESSESLFKDVSAIEVRFDGKGKLSVFYEKGTPKLIKLSYTNGNGFMSVGVKTFDEIEAHNPLSYENKAKPGKAIVVERGSNFKEGDDYNLLIRIRSGINPDRYISYPIVFHSELNNPRLSSQGREFDSILITPGVSMFTWDGTFKKVEFKN
jgi:hypothetical protein